MIYANSLFLSRHKWKHKTHRTKQNGNQFTFTNHKQKNKLPQRHRGVCLSRTCSRDVQRGKGRQGVESLVDGVNICAVIGCCAGGGDGVVLDDLLLGYRGGTSCRTALWT